MKFLSILTNVNFELDLFGFKELVVHIFLYSVYRGNAFLTN